MILPNNFDFSLQKTFACLVKISCPHTKNVNETHADTANQYADYIFLDLNEG